MSLRSFAKEIWRLIWDYKKNILIITLVTTILSLVLSGFVKKHDNMVEKENESELVEYKKIGMLNIYEGSDSESYQIEPFLPKETIEEIHTWSNFKAFFSLSSTDPEIHSTQSLDEYFDESFNPVEGLLGLDPKQLNKIKIHPDTEKAYLTFEVDPGNGNVKLVNTTEGFNDFKIQLDITDEGTNLSNMIGQDVDDLVKFKIGMTPGSEQLGYLESTYNWTNGVTYPRLLSNQKNFYIKDPIEFTASSSFRNQESIYKELFLPTVISGFIGFVFSLVVMFLWAIFQKDIKYSFAYSWSAEDLYLSYDKHDTFKQIAYDILQSNYHDMAVISEVELPSKLLTQLEEINVKNMSIYNEISSIEIGKQPEEFVIIVKKGSTTKKWYDRQRKHLKAYKEKSVKIVEL